jgi:uncharacterized protein (TIGR04255 family)
VNSPFSSETSVEVPLERAPLVKVLVQLRFPTIAKIDSIDAVAAFQEQLEARYPILRPEHQVPLVPVGAVMPPVQVFGTIWRMSNTDSTWVVVLARDFVAMETTAYASRADFVERWAEVLRALPAANLAPAVYDRLGIRYIDRLAEEEMVNDLAVLVRPELLGITNVALPSGSSMVANVTQTQFQIDGLEMKASWGIIPARTVILPGIDAVDTRSWILDVDVYREQQVTFDTTSIVDLTATAAGRAYEFFRWSVTPEFLRRHGGEA